MQFITNLWCFCTSWFICRWNVIELFFHIIKVFFFSFFKTSLGNHISHVMFWQQDSSLHTTDDAIWGWTAFSSVFNMNVKHWSKMTCPERHLLSMIQKKTQDLIITDYVFSVQTYIMFHCICWCLTLFSFFFLKLILNTIQSGFVFHFVISWGFSRTYRFSILPCMDTK